MDHGVDYVCSHRISVCCLMFIAHVTPNPLDDSQSLNSYFSSYSLAPVCVDFSVYFVDSCIAS